MAFFWQSTGINSAAYITIMGFMLRDLPALCVSVQVAGRLSGSDSSTLNKTSQRHIAGSSLATHKIT